jgi:hypothetical protein
MAAGRPSSRPTRLHSAICGCNVSPKHRASRKKTARSHAFKKNRTSPLFELASVLMRLDNWLAEVRSRTSNDQKTVLSRSRVSKRIASHSALLRRPKRNDPPPLKTPLCLCTSIHRASHIPSRSRRVRWLPLARLRRSGRNIKNTR